MYSYNIAELIHQNWHTSWPCNWSLVVTVISTQTLHKVATVLYILQRHKKSLKIQRQIQNLSWLVTLLILDPDVYNLFTLFTLIVEVVKHQDFIWHLQNCTVMKNSYLCCKWSFIYSFPSRSLQFLAFDTEASHDMLKVWDGPPENEMSLAELSGSLIPEGIHSTLNTVTVQFETDFYISKSGFAIQFSSKFCS